MASAKSDQPAGAEQGPKKRRRGGKPTGYKHSGTQRQLVGSEASDVRRAFLAALNEALPFAAFAELRSLAPSDVPRWADRWWIHAPCVLEQAEAIVSMAEGEPEPDVEIWRSLLEQFTDSYRGPEKPPRWRSRLSELNGLKVDASWLDDVLNSPIEPIAERPDFSAYERQLDDCLKRLASCGKSGPRLADGFKSSLREAGGLQDTARLHRRLALLRRPLANLQNRRRLHSDIPHWLGSISKILNDADTLRQLVADARAKALKQPRVLAPIAADPTRESREHFLKRAANHWSARDTEADEVLRESGQSVSAPAPKPNMQHIDWLIRHQVKGESRVEIAGTKGFQVSEKTVRVEIQRLARLLDLKLRPGPPKGVPENRRWE